MSPVAFGARAETFPEFNSSTPAFFEPALDDHLGRHRALSLAFLGLGVRLFL